MSFHLGQHHLFSLFVLPLDGFRPMACPVHRRRIAVVAVVAVVACLAATCVAQLGMLLEK